MPRAFGETVVQDATGNKLSGVPVDLVDPITGIRIVDTVFLDASSGTVQTLPLTTDSQGHVAWYLTTGKLVKAITSILSVVYYDLINTVDATASGGGGAPIAHIHVESDTTNLTTDLASLAANLSSKAAVAHTHAEADTTGLAGDLAAKSATGHSHTQKWQGKAAFSPPFAGDVVTDARPENAITPTTVYAKRIGGTGATADITKNGVSQLTAPISMTTAAWTAGTLIASPAIAAGDSVVYSVPTVTGGVTEVIITLNGTETIL